MPRKAHICSSRTARSIPYQLVVGGGSYVVSADGKTLTAATFGYDTQLRQFSQQTVRDRPWLEIAKRELRGYVRRHLSIRLTGPFSLFRVCPQDSACPELLPSESRIVDGKLPLADYWLIA
jgi:hypothetical protein